MRMMYILGLNVLIKVCVTAKLANVNVSPDMKALLVNVPLVLITVMIVEHVGQNVF